MLKIITYLVIVSVGVAFASIGDRSPVYQRCLDRCQILNCSEDGTVFVSDHHQAVHLKTLAWSCLDECKYNCMWKTVESFHQRNWKTPQFHGKWPFIRLFGIQEPASFAFSLLNLIVHLKMIKKFHRQVRSDSPLYWLWFGFCLICCNAWFWSAIFHARDFPLTELLDYACAFSIVLVNCYVMQIRIFRYVFPRFLHIILTIFFLAFFVNHTAYLSMGRFDYEYNMQLNVLVGTITAISWFIWAVLKRNKQPYVWKCSVYVAMTGLVLMLEIIDQPPIFYVFDCHSLWHLATAPLVVLIYSFAIDDCCYLRKTEIEAAADKYRSKIR
ncbi:post-GPI attachment to proteins factor 3 isoform X1 [Euwallacea fornicatus]|uniref:post-GPI attachment to proteins factor 3 isoform X1 n=1 Tax=Euwallacea fornicatus TaxID=995702 RepID=UPI00338FF248